MTQSNPNFLTRNWTQSNPTQSMDESNPCPTLCRRLCGQWYISTSHRLTGYNT